MKKQRFQQKFHSMETNKFQLNILTGWHNNPVYATELNVECQFLISKGNDRIKQIWKLADGEIVANLQLGS